MVVYKIPLMVTFATCTTAQYVCAGVLLLGIASVKVVVAAVAALVVAQALQPVVGKAKVAGGVPLVVRF